jgi:H+/Cl- antiporter ClcA
MTQNLAAGMKTPPPLLSSAAAVLALPLLLGREAVLTREQEQLSDASILTVLVMSLAIGTLVMHYDILDMAKQEAKKQADSLQQSSSTSSAGQFWFVFTSLLVLIIGIAVAWFTKIPAGRYSPIVQDIWTHTQMLDPYTIWPLADSILSQVFGIDVTAHLPEAVGSCVHREVIGIIDASGAKTKCYLPKSPRAWNTAVNWSNEVAIFFLSAALVIGFASSRSDVSEMSREQDSVAAGDSDFPVAKKALKCSKARLRWRPLVCGFLLLAAAVSMGISMVDGKR